MHSVVCDVCAYVYDEDGDGILVFDNPEEAVHDVLRHHWMCLTDGRAICPSDDEEHQATYDELMPPEPKAEVDEQIPPDEER
jgi:rubredoxin